MSALEAVSQSHAGGWEPKIGVQRSEACIVASVPAHKRLQMPLEYLQRMPRPVGVCAIQGDYEKHLDAVRRVGGSGCEVRTPEDLDKVERLIIPGGESTTVGLLMQRYGLGEAVQRRSAAGMPVWGTCMGMILLAREVEDRPDQWTLGIMDVAVRRNAFGSQVHSFECEFEMAEIESSVTGVFIRAPILTRLGPKVLPLATLEGKVIAARQDKLLGTSFHPELTEDTRLHRYFLSL